MRRLKLSQKDMEHRLHPWMSTETRQSIKDLESDESRGRRRTIRGDANLSGHRPTAKDDAKTSFRTDRTNAEEDWHADEFQTQHNSTKNISHGGGKPTEGACINGSCSIF